MLLNALLVLAPLTTAATAAGDPSVGEGARPRVAVLTVGDDPAAVGSLQASLASRVATSQSLQLLGPTELIHAIWHTPPPEDPPLDLATEQRCEAALEEVSSAYYAGSPDRALEALGRLDRLIAIPSSAVLTLRKASLLWRTTILLDQKNRAAAADSARAALALDPGLEVPLKVYPPNVQDFIEELRRDPPRPVEVSLEISPRSARIKVDGRSETTRFSIAPGRHYLRVEAPGYRTVETVLEVRRDRALSVGLAPRLPTDLEAIALQLLRESPATAPQACAYLAERLHVGAIAVGTTGTGGIQARIWSKQRPEISATVIARPSTAVGQAQLSESVALGLEGGFGERPVGSQRPLFGWEAGWSAAVRPWSLSGGGNGVSTLFAGSGPALLLREESLGWEAEASLGWLGYLGPTASGAGPGPGFPSGGSSLLASLSGARRFGLGQGLLRSASIGSLYLRLGYEHRFAQDLSGPNGPYGFFASYEYTALELGGGLRLPELRLASGPASLSFSAGVSPFATFAEFPSGTYGTSSRVDPVPALGAKLSWTRRRWRLRAEYRGEWRTIRFSGSGRAPFQTPLEGAALSEVLNELTFAVERAGR